MAEKSEIVIIVMFLMSLFHPQKVAFIWDGKDPPQGDMQSLPFTVSLPSLRNNAVYGHLSSQNIQTEQFGEHRTITAL